MSAIQCDRDTFFRNLQQSGLLKPHDFRKVVEHMPPTDRGRIVARKLVEAGILTRFQAELLLIGRTHGFFLGQYKILDLLGQGGMGRVYKAMHLPMKRIVALKVLAPQLVQTARAMKMFKQEVRSAARLNHPNIVTAYDANHVNDRYYLAMEFVDGPNLDQLVRQRTQLSVGMACEVIRQAATGLQHAFDLNLVHRDIKPANLLLQKPARPGACFTVKILDFGLAHLQESAEEALPRKDNTILGTPDFLSPEQSRNLPGVDIRSDVYSLGCTFYFLLTGRVPFPGGLTLEKLLRHSNEAPVTVELFRSDVPPEILAILNRMMAKKPEDRQQTPQQVVDALTAFAKVSAADMDLSAVDVPLIPPTLPSNPDIEVKPPSSPGSQPTHGPQATDAPMDAGDEEDEPPSSEDLPLPFVREGGPTEVLPPDATPHGSVWLLALITLIVSGLAIMAAIMLAR